MRLDDEQIERYSRQLILTEVGPRGQERLGVARVAVVGVGVAAERVVAYLAAGGVGWIAADPALGSAIDPAQPDVDFTPLDAACIVDAVVITAATSTAAAEAGETWRTHAATRFWIVGGRAGGVAPCPRCALSGGAPAAVAGELIALRDATLATVIATEVVKTLLAIGTGLAGRVLAYDPTTATVDSLAVAAHPGCACDVAAS